MENKGRYLRQKPWSRQEEVDLGTRHHLLSFLVERRTLHDGRKHQNSEKAWGDDDEWQMLGANKLTDRAQ